MVYTPSQFFSLEEFIAQYGDNTRYQLIDGELRDMEPTGPHEAVSGSVAGRIYLEIFRQNLDWLVPKNCLIKPLYAEATALRPDVIVLDRHLLSQEPLWHKEPIICNGSTITALGALVSYSPKDPPKSPLKRRTSTAF